MNHLGIFLKCNFALVDLVVMGGVVVGSGSVSKFPASAAGLWKILLRKEGRDGRRETEACRGYVAF